MKINIYLIIFLLFVLIIILFIYLKKKNYYYENFTDNNIDQLFIQGNVPVIDPTKIIDVNRKHNSNNNFTSNSINNSNNNFNNNSNNNSNNNFTSNSTSNNNSNNFLKNLIINGNFDGGKNILNYAGQNGINNIVKKKNPGNSQYVLEQSKSDTLTYYEIICDNESNSKYNLYCWISASTDNTNKTINDLDLKKLIKIRIQNKDFTNYIPSLNYDIIKKVNLQNDINTWYLVKYNFISTSSTSDKMYIYLNYSNNFIFNNIYFCEVSLFKVLIDAENFIYNDKLICFTDGSNYESNTTTWHDLSGNGNDLFWSSMPNVNYNKGYINTNNVQLKCFPSILLSNTAFTIILCINKDNKPTSKILFPSPSNEESNEESNMISNEESNMVSNEESNLVSNEESTIPTNNKYMYKSNSESEESEYRIPTHNKYIYKSDSESEESEYRIPTHNKLKSNELIESFSNESYLLSIPGNSNYFFEIKIVNDILYLIVGKNIYKAINKLILYNKTFINIIYSNGILNIYQDNTPLIKQKIEIPSLNNNNIVINRNSNLDINLYSTLFYNRKVEKDELEHIKDYFISNNNKNNNTPNLNNFVLSFLEKPLNVLYDNVYNDFIKPFSKKNNTENNFNDDTSNFNSIFGNNDFRLKYNKNNCPEECESKCSKYLSNPNKDDYNSCINDCENTLDSCKLYCNENIESNNNSKYCINKNINKNNKADVNCPTVYKKDGNYMIHVNPNSSYYNLYTQNDKSYGSDIDKAKYLYHKNYPKCSIPDELINCHDNNINTCRFVINENNPCYANSCAGVNWNVSDHNNLNLNDQCKKSVSHYCRINSNIDDECYCWKPEYKDDEKCISIRKYFENPLDYCNPKSFNIEDHPDFKNYIRKDNIPCWGCKLE